MNTSKINIRLHLTNISGTGATQLLESLLPSIINNKDYFIKCAYLPNRGILKVYKSFSSSTSVKVYWRLLPNSISRFLECTIAGLQFSGRSSLFVFGDIPIFCISKQIVFLHQSLLLKKNHSKQINVLSFKYFVSKLIFYLNCKFVNAYIVQTHLMRELLLQSYPIREDRVHVIPIPVPSWLSKSGIKRTCRINNTKNSLDLFYPASFYKHKNHSILSELSDETQFLINKFYLTIDSSHNPCPKSSCIICLGHLEPSQILNLYSKIDALIFLSKEESYGFPLVEAMYLGLPIICPDLPYAHEVCGDSAIYFKVDNFSSLYNAIYELNVRLSKGWWPDWKIPLSRVSTNWDIVAKHILCLA